MLTRNHQQEALSWAYVQAVIAKAGCTYSVRSHDYGVDLSALEIWARGRRKVESGLRVDLQVKSTAGAAKTADRVLFDLDRDAYDDLRAVRHAIPRLLVLVVLAEQEPRRLEQTEEGLLIRDAAYWHDLAGAPPTTNVRSVRLRIPRVNLFTPEALLGWFARLREGEPE